MDDRQTDRRQTDGRARACSKREFTLIFVFQEKIAHDDFKFGVKYLTGSRILTVFAHAHQKIG